MNNATITSLHSLVLGGFALASVFLSDCMLEQGIKELKENPSALSVNRSS
jgi:hypothetical protein